MTKERLKKLYSELTNDQLLAEIRWRSQLPWTSTMISGADCMISPNIKAICREILKERGVEDNR